MTPSHSAGPQSPHFRVHVRGRGRGRVLSAPPQREDHEGRAGRLLRHALVHLARDATRAARRGASAAGGGGLRGGGGSVLPRVHSQQGAAEQARGVHLQLPLALLLEHAARLGRPCGERGVVGAAVGEGWRNDSKPRDPRRVPLHADSVLAEPAGGLQRLQAGGFALRGV